MYIVKQKISTLLFSLIYPPPSAFKFPSTSLHPLPDICRLTTTPISMCSLPLSGTSSLSGCPPYPIIPPPPLQPHFQNVYDIPHAYLLLYAGLKFTHLRKPTSDSL